MERNKAKRAPSKRVRENEILDSVGSTSGLVQQHASSSCSPKILRLSESETCKAVQLPPGNSSSSSHNNRGFSTPPLMLYFIHSYIRPRYFEKKHPIEDMKIYIIIKGHTAKIYWEKTSHRDGFSQYILFFLVSTLRVCVVYVVKKIASFPGARSINGRGT